MRIEGWQHEIGGAGWWARVLGFAAAAGLLLGLVGPFGSYLNGGFPLLVVHWVVITVFGATVSALLIPRIVGILASKGVPLGFALGVGIILAALPIAAVSAVEVRFIWPWQTAKLTAVDWYVQSLMMTALVVGGWLLFELALARSSELHPRGPSSNLTQSDLAGSPVICLQMEDHYVRIHSTAGSMLELMTMQDAVSRYGVAGLQVHRSWWLSFDAVRRCERDGRNWRLRLRNGLSVPVARNRVAASRAAGLIAPSAIDHEIGHPR